MGQYLHIASILAAFLIIAVASNQIAKLFQKIKLPLITGFIIIGLIISDNVLELINFDDIKQIHFINEISLAFIAFSAGAELYLKELRSRFFSIKWMTIGQLVVTFVLSFLIVFLISDSIDFISEFSYNIRLAISLLIATIFVARSPASAIAIINEMRAKGPFTQTALGVTVVKDVLVIILFAVSISISDVLIFNLSFNYLAILLIVLGIAISFVLGFFLGKTIEFIIKQKFNINYKAFGVLFLGFLSYLLSKQVEYFSVYYSISFRIEPLLICILASFYIANYTKVRREFLRIIEKLAPPIYLLFFTLAGASISVSLIIKYWWVTLVFFSIRFGSLILGAILGSIIAKEPKKTIPISWMPYVTQAGIAIGLSTIIADKYPQIGENILSILISVIFINQIIGPPFFKWAINIVGESHLKKKGGETNNTAIIIGYEAQSVLLAKQLEQHNWQVKIASTYLNIDNKNNLKIQSIKDYSLQSLNKIDAYNAKSLILMLSDEENIKICQIAYEDFGTQEIVVRLHHHFNFDRFHKLGALIVYPDTAIVSLLDHYVRSPIATCLLLGMESRQDVVDMEVKSPDIHGLALRDIRIPSDAIILSTQRGGQKMISTGFTRLRLGDTISVVGSVESIEKIRLRVEGV